MLLLFLQIEHRHQNLCSMSKVPPLTLPLTEVIDLTVSSDEESNVDASLLHSHGNDNESLKRRLDKNDLNDNQSKKIKGGKGQGGSSSTSGSIICIHDDDSDEDKDEDDNINTDTNSPHEALHHSIHFEIDGQDGRDNGILTTDIQLPPPRGNILTCSAVVVTTCLQSSSSSNTRSSSTNSHARSRAAARSREAATDADADADTAPVPFGTLTHIQQRDKWSCGFRNLQMILCALLPNIDSHHKLRNAFVVPVGRTHGKSNSNSSSSITNSSSSTTRGHIMIPSIHQIQDKMEQSWKQGFDQTGVKHFHGKIKGKKSLIGALEASSVLTHCFVDSTVVQFIACRESRSLLGRFVWEYFNFRRGIGTGAGIGIGIGTSAGTSAGTSRNDCMNTACYFCSRSTSFTSMGLVVELMQLAEESVDIHEHEKEAEKDYNNGAGAGAGKPGAEACDHPVLPLYLQWEGHSVTIVGIEKNNGDEYYNLLVLDPMKKWKDASSSSASASSSAASSSNGFEWTDMDSLRLSTKTTMKKDCQLVVFSLEALSEQEREEIRCDENSNVVTAASQRVHEVRNAAMLH